MSIPLALQWQIHRLRHPDPARRAEAIRKIAATGRADLRAPLLALLADEDGAVRAEAHRALLGLRTTELTLFPAYAAAFGQGIRAASSEAFDAIERLVINGADSRSVDQLARWVSSGAAYFRDEHYDHLAAATGQGDRAERFLHSLVSACKAYQPGASCDESMGVQRLARQCAYLASRNDAHSAAFLAKYRQELALSPVPNCRVLSLELLTILLEAGAVSVEDGVRLFANHLNDADPRVSGIAIFSLGHSAHVTAGYHLLERHVSGRFRATWQVSEEAETVEALGRLEHPQAEGIAFGILRPFSEHPYLSSKHDRADYRTAAAAVRALHNMGCDCREPLMSILARFDFQGDPLNSGFETRQRWRESATFLETVAEVLGSFEDRASIPSLIRRMADSRKSLYTDNAAARALARMDALTEELQDRYAMTPWGEQWDYDNTRPGASTAEGRRSLHKYGNLEIARLRALLEEPIWIYCNLNVRWASRHLPRWSYRRKREARPPGERSRWIGFGRLVREPGGDGSAQEWEYTSEGLRVAGSIRDLELVCSRLAS